MDNKTPTNRLGKKIGGSGTTIFNGIITAEEYNNRLIGKSGLRMYDIMRRSEESVQAALKMVKYPLLNVERRIEPASDDENDIFIAKYVEHQLLKNPRLNFFQFAKEAMTFFDFGHSVAEKTYELTTYEGRTLVGINDISFRKQTSIEAWEMENGKPGITQRLLSSDKQTATVSIPLEKLMIWTHDKEGDNHAGISLLRYAFKSWDMADKLGLVHAIGLEKMAIPTPVLKMPATVDTAAEQNAEASIQQYRSNEKAYMKIPDGWSVEKFDLSGQSIDQLLPALQHYERKILLSVLGQFLTLGTASGSGSRATSEDHSRLFMLAEEAANRMFQDTIQEQLINQLVDINFSNLPNGYPQLKSASIQEDDVTALADAVQKLKNANMLTATYETENHLRKVVKLPELPEDYKDDYEKKREMSNNPIDTSETANPAIKKNDDQTLDKESTKAAIVQGIVEANREVIDIIVKR